MAVLEIDEGEIAIIAGGDAALGSDAEDARRARAQQVDHPFDGQPPLRGVIEHQREDGLHSRQA